MPNKVGRRTKTIVCLLAAAAVPAASGTAYIMGALWSLPAVPDHPISVLQQIESVAELLRFAFGVAFLHVAVLGLPAFLLGMRLRAIRWWSCLIMGFLIGMGPFAAAASDAMNFKLAEFQFYGYLGAIGGFTFWLLWHFWLREQQ